MLRRPRLRQPAHDRAAGCDIVFAAGVPFAFVDCQSIDRRPLVLRAPLSDFEKERHSRRQMNSTRAFVQSWREPIVQSLKFSQPLRQAFR